MASNEPCTACSWTPDRQDSCRYHSHVKLFYGVSDRGAWSLGSKFILKDRSCIPPNFDARNIRYLQRETKIPVPAVLTEWTDDGALLTILQRIDGVPLQEAWPELLPAEKDHIAKQTADYLVELRRLQSDRLQSLDGEPLYSAFLFRNGFGLPHGPCTSDDELWKEMDQALEKLPGKVRSAFRKRMPPAAPYTFTHGDLSTGNIMVKDGVLVGIIDWEASGYFPVWWEFTATGIHEGDEDRDWKILLRKHMDNHADAQEFWKDYSALSRMDERGANLLRELQSEDE